MKRMNEFANQIALFAAQDKLTRKNQYEIPHCTNCGCIVPDRILMGNWPDMAKYTIRYCPNCGAEFQGAEQNDEARMRKPWRWEAAEPPFGKGDTE